MPKSYEKQNYAKIKKICLKEGTLFDDTNFPADNRSLFRGKGQSDIEWLRPKEICRVPRLIVEGASTDNFVYDDISRAWFASACVGLVREPKLFNRVLPEAVKQEFTEKNEYAGIFKFSIWRMGEWLEVVVDDRLPTKGGQLSYCRPGSKNEFWAALLEKAYAKLHGDYESLLHGSFGDALVDFTGGVCEKIDLHSVHNSDPTVKKSLFNKLKDSFENKALMNCYIALTPEPTDNLPIEEEQLNPEPSDNLPIEEERTDEIEVGTDGPTGLVNGVGYIITMVKDVEFKGTMKTKVKTNQLQLIRLFNPSTKGQQWRGAWSPKSEEMSRLGVMEWEKLGIRYEKEDEFWMDFKDVQDIFTSIEICHLLNTSYFTLKKSWCEAALPSAWCSYNNRDGGGNWDSITILHNPQFVFDITAEKDTVIVSLEQREKSHDNQTGDLDYQTIGFYILKVEQNRMYRIHTKDELVYKSEFMKSRNIYGKTEVEKGRYVVVACCSKKGAQVDFLFRLFTTNSASAKELIKECPQTGCCRPKYKIVSTVEVVKADGLKLPEADAKGTLNPFVVIECEGTKVTSDYKKNTKSPLFRTRATFYRKKPENNIKIEVYNRNTLFNTFIAQGEVKMPAKESSVPEGGEEGETIVMELFGRKKEAEIKKPGKLRVFMKSSHDLACL